MKRLSWDGSNSDSFAILHDHLVDFGVTLQVQVLMGCSSGVNVGVGRVASPSRLRGRQFELSQSWELHLHRG